MTTQGYKKCIKLMKEIRNSGFDKQIPARELNKFIGRWIGTDPRTIENYHSILLLHEFIKYNGNGIFEIIEKTEKLY